PRQVIDPIPGGVSPRRASGVELLAIGKNDGNRCICFIMYLQLSATVSSISDLEDRVFENLSLDRQVVLINSRSLVGYGQSAQSQVAQPYCFQCLGSIGKGWIGKVIYSEKGRLRKFSLVEIWQDLVVVNTTTGPQDRSPALIKFPC